MKFDYGSAVNTSTEANLNMTMDPSQHRSGFHKIDQPSAFRQPERIRSLERVPAETRYNNMPASNDVHLPSPFVSAAIAPFKKKQKLSRRLPKVFNFVKGSRNITFTHQKNEEPRSHHPGVYNNNKIQNHNPSLVPTPDFTQQDLLAPS